jgi:polysaccharide pyruvyl transferase CsaB
MRVLLLNGDTDGNLGDQAILRSMCQELRRVEPTVRLTVVSADPQNAGPRYEADVVKRGWRGLPRLCAAAMRSDLTLCGGGGLFQDDDSLIKMPYWMARVLLVRLLGTPVIGYSLGVGPLRAWTSRLAGRVTFRLMRRISVRDPEAQRTAQPLSRATVELVPDPALLLTPVSEQTTTEYLQRHGVPTDGTMLIGVAPRRYFPARRRLIPNVIRSRWSRIDLDDSEEAQRLTTLLASTLDEVAQRHNAHIVFMPTYTRSHEGDDRVARYIQQKMTLSDRTHMLRIDDPALYKGIAGQLAVLLGGRMHPTIFAAAVGTPVVGLAYNQKFHGFFELLGQSSALIDIDQFIRGDCPSRLTDLLETAIGRDKDPIDRATALAEQVRRFTADILRAAA